MAMRSPDYTPGDVGGFYMCVILSTDDKELHPSKNEFRMWLHKLIADCAAGSECKTNGIQRCRKK